MAKPLARVFFATAMDHGHLTIRRWFKITRRSPKLGKHLFFEYLIKTLGRSELCHCAISYNGAVLDCTVKGNSFYALIPYAMTHPTLACCFDLLDAGFMDLDRYPNGGGERSPWPTFFRWLTCGLTPATDCTATTCDCLREAGINVPKTVTTPQKLYDWLCKQGYPHVEFTPGS